MQSRVDTFVETMSDTDKLQCIQDWEYFEQHGAIGDCVLRDQTAEFQKYVNIEEDMHVVLWMDKVAMACYKYYAQLYIQEHS